MRPLLIALSLVAVSQNGFCGDVWQPEKTWVFAVGVLNFDKQGLATWPDAGRVDAQMIASYQKRGVKPEHIVFIKNEKATKANIKSEFSALLGQTAPGETLVFYYAGHGGRDYNDPARTVSLVTYDTAKTWRVGEVFDQIEKEFKGSQVLLTADCCHAGGLAVEAEKRQSKLKYGVLTSAHATSRSTGNWTFTQCLVDLLDGNGALDANGDGKITFAEAARYCEAEMAFCEGQLACSAAVHGFASDIVLMPTVKKTAPKVGDHCEGEDKGKWWKVKILDAKDGKYFVTWIGWDKKFDAWVDANQLRPYTPPAPSVAKAAEVEWENTWYPAEIKERKLGLALIHYVGYPESDDEWISLDRLRYKK